MKQNFIQTTDPETAEKLVKLGFQEIPSSGNARVFLNCQVLTFEEQDMKQLSYTNKLCI